MICNKRNEKIVLLILYILSKISFDFGFIKMVSWDVGTYHPGFVLTKYIVGWLFCFILFFPIDFSKRKASSFFLSMVLILQILPISTIYSFCEGDSFFYFELCIGFLLCEIIVSYSTIDDNSLYRNNISSKLYIIFLVSLALIVFLYMVSKNGIPSTTALNIYDVYEVRESASEINKYIGYALQCTMYIIMPIALSFCIQKKRVVLSFFLMASVFLMYLYTGNKTELFSVFLVIVCTFFSGENKADNLLLIILMISIVFLSWIAVLSHVQLLENMYSLFIRRCCFVPAVNKFSYYDYFSIYPKLGIHGIFPTWIIPYDGYYLDVDYVYEISRIFYGKPTMASNTGFLAEGFARFGHLGTIIVMSFFALIVKFFDSLQTRTNYQTVVGCFSYCIFALCDKFLLSSFFLGPWMIIAMFLLFFFSEKNGSVINRVRL